MVILSGVQSHRILGDAGALRARHCVGLIAGLAPSRWAHRGVRPPLAVSRDVRTIVYGNLSFCSARRALFTVRSKLREVCEVTRRMFKLEEWEDRCVEPHAVARIQCRCRF